MKIDLIEKYAPHIFFDKREPFLPLNIGYEIFNETRKSNSFNRIIEVTGDTSFVIEYQYFWYFDIEHLYELEHVWVYIDDKGNVCDCEGSFHGKFLKGLLKDKSNIENRTHVKLYSQPGKHAFSPLKEIFELVPNMYSSCYERVGKGGLLVNDMFKDKISTNDEINYKVREYMQRYKFIPSLEYCKYYSENTIYITWNELYTLIPVYIENKIKEIYKDV